MGKIISILVDDEPRGLTSLQKLLKLNCPEVDVQRLCSSAEEASKAIYEITPDLIFLDIAMPGKTGLDSLRELPEIQFETIFVTAHNNYAMQACSSVRLITC